MKKKGVLFHSWGSLNSISNFFEFSYVIGGVFEEKEIWFLKIMQMKLPLKML